MWEGRGRGGHGKSVHIGHFWNLLCLQHLDKVERECEMTKRNLKDEVSGGTHWRNEVVV